MFAIIFLAVYAAANVWIGVEIFSWLKSCGNIFQKKAIKTALLIIYVLLGLMIIAAFFIPTNWELKKLLSRIGNYYEGFFVNIIITIIAAHILAIILKLIRVVPKKYFNSGKPKRVSGIICAALAVIISVYGCINANYIRTTNYDVSIDKSGEDMKIVLVSDLHLGYSLGYRNMEQMAAKINASNPDLVCIAGDIFDNNYDALDDPEKIISALASIKSTYGTYACWGNHDVSDKLLNGFTVNPSDINTRDSRMEELLKKANINVLEDETTVIDDKFTLIGRIDANKPVSDNGERMNVDEFEFDTSKPVIMINHEPMELQEKADAGIDLDLCGHTHNGQIFPGTLLIKLLWENPAGYLKKTGNNGNILHSVVTEGVGVYGPFMRTGCKSEIVNINVHFTK